MTSLLLVRPALRYRSMRSRRAQNVGNSVEVAGLIIATWSRSMPWVVAMC